MKLTPSQVKKNIRVQSDLPSTSRALGVHNYFYGRNEPNRVRFVMEDGTQYVRTIKDHQVSGEVAFEMLNALLNKGDYLFAQGVKFINIV